MTWQSGLTGFLAGLLISIVTSPVGVSGAVFLLPVQLSVLHVPSPAVTPTNLLFNVVSGPGEQYLPWLPDEVVVVFRSKDTGGRLLTLHATARALEPGSTDRGPLRIVTGEGGEFFWTEDHYETFARILRRSM